jgi:hypothetical protein
MPVLSFSEIIRVQFLVLQHQMYREIWPKERDCLLYSENMLRTPLSNWQYACIQITVAIFKVSNQNQKLFPSSFDNQKSAFISKDLILSYETMMGKLHSCRETLFIQQAKEIYQICNLIQFSKSLNSIFPLSKRNTANCSCKSYTYFKTMPSDNQPTSVWSNSYADLASI